MARLAADLATALDRLAARTGAPVAATATSRPAPPDRMSTPLVATHAGFDRGRLVRLLADAKSATIVGVSNTWVAGCAEAALADKRRSNGAEAFWDHLDVVFLSEDLLPYLRDQFSLDFPTHGRPCGTGPGVPARPGGN